MPETSFVTIAVAAAHLSVSTKTIRRMISRGDLRARRVGPRMVRIEEASLDTVGKQLSHQNAA